MSILVRVGLPVPSTLVLAFCDRILGHLSSSLPPHRGAGQDLSPSLLEAATHQSLFYNVSEMKFYSIFLPSHKNPWKDENKQKPRTDQEKPTVPCNGGKLVTGYS